MNNKEILDDIEKHSYTNIDNFSFDEIYSSLFVGKHNEDIEKFFGSFGIDYDDVIESKSKDVNERLIEIRSCMKMVSEMMKKFMLDVFFKPHINDEEISNIEFLKTYKDMERKIVTQYDLVQKLLIEIYWSLEDEKSKN